MLNLKRSSGQSILVEAPSGLVVLRVVRIEPELAKVTVEIAVPPTWPPVESPVTLRQSDRIIFDTPSGPFTFAVLDFRLGPRGFGTSLILGIDAPKAWPVTRPEAKKVPPAGAVPQSLPSP